MFIDYLWTFFEYFMIGLFFLLPVVFIIACILSVYYIYKVGHLKDNTKYEKIMERKNLAQLAVSVVGILEANALIIFFAIHYNSFGLPLVIPIILFIIAQVMIVNKDFNINLKQIDKIQLTSTILLIVIALTFIILGYNLSLVNTRGPIPGNEEAHAQNSRFENYFGSDVTATEVKNLLSEIRTNNLTSQRNEDQTIIGVCFISKDVKQDDAHAIYNLDINPKDFNKKDSYELMFTANVETITDLLEKGTSYTVNVPNTKAFKDDQEGKTGFESDNGGIETLVKGESGGYYSSGYIRLIYIIDNRNRASSTTNNDVTNYNYNQTYNQYPSTNISINQNVSRNADY